MTSLIKRIGIGIIAASLAVGSAGCSSPFGGMSSKKPVEVRNVGSMNGYLYYGESEDESHTGTVSSDYVQQVFIDSSMTVEKIYVKEGDIVKKGSKLLKYNMESEELDLKLEDLEIQLQEQKLKKLQKELEKLKSTKTVPDSTTEAEDNDTDDDTSKNKTNTVDTDTDTDTDTDLDDTDSDLDGKIQTPGPAGTDILAAVKELFGMEAFAEESTANPTQFDTSNKDYQAYEANAGKNTENGMPVRFYLLGSKGNEASIQGSILKTFCGSSATYIFYQCATEEDLKKKIYDKSLTFTINGNNQKTIIDETINDDTMYPINICRQHQRVLGNFLLSGADDMTKNGKVGRGNIHHFYTSATYSDGSEVTGIKVEYSVLNNTSPFTTIDQNGVLQVGPDETINNTLIISVNMNGHIKRIELTVIEDDTHAQMENDEQSMINNGAANSSMDTVVGDAESSKKGSDSKLPNDSDKYDGLDGTDDSSPTESMLKEEIQEKEEEIWETEKAIAEGKIKYKEDKAKIVKATIKAKFKGTVTKSCTLDNLPSDNTPAIIVKARTGMFIHFLINELELDDVSLGGKIVCKSWANSEEYEAEITEISPYPSSDDSGDSFSMTAMNPNSSYYPVTAYVEDADGLNSGDQVYVLFDSVSMGKTESGLYLEKKYVRSDGGSYYVYKRGKDKLLHKQQVKVGKSVEEYYEILDGLTDDDYIAFPYPDKDMVEGAETEIVEVDSDQGYGIYEY